MSCSSRRPDYPAAAMRSKTILLAAFVLVINCLVSAVSGQGSTTSKWQTLDGSQPLVIARGGFSGVFPDSSFYAYQVASVISVANAFLWCDVQLTKDSVGICSPNVRLDNASDISQVYKNRVNTYLVNGDSLRGWFSVDFTYRELNQVVLTQGVFSRSNKFDGNLFPFLPVENVSALAPPAGGMWLNIQHDAFFTQHNLSMRSYVLSISRKVPINYISSPEAAFLQVITPRFNPNMTKLVYRILGPTDVDPSINQTYGDVLKNLTFIKTFASGILVPKSYIWPVDASLYLQPHTSLVSDAHKAGLQVFASEFYNDVPFSYNYSYDPVSEYINFVDNGDFSVDGVLSDFPLTPSQAFVCYAHINKNVTARANITVISKNGASGDYPGCTDMAYQKAISDGADVIDCPVQISKDKIPFCLSSINLIDSTTVAQTNYSNRAKIIPQLKAGSGIFSFSLDWSEIQTLTPAIANPFSTYELFRNPKNRNAGKFLTLSDFLAKANGTDSLTGVLISIENAAYLLEEQQISVTDIVLQTLKDAGYDTIAKDVQIQSTNSSVLMKFKGKNNKLVYKVDENIRGADKAAIDDIKKFANAVVVSKNSVFPDDSLFLTGSTDVVTKFQSVGIPVYVELFSNEFVSQAWDFFSDASVEINSYVAGANISGVITGYPKTSARYKRNRCLNLGNRTPPYMSPVQPGGLLQLITADSLPPAEAPNPLLTESDVAESPLPSATSPSPGANGGNTTGAPETRNGQHKIAACFFLSNVAILFTIVLLL